jgi:hypothetical protein
MARKMSFFAKIIVDGTLQKIRESLPNARISISQSGERCSVDIRRGGIRALIAVQIGLDAQIDIVFQNSKLQRKYSLNHPNTLDCIVSHIVSNIQNPFGDESFDPDLRRDLLVCKGILTVQGQSEEQKQWIYALAEEALKDFGLEPLRCPNSRRDQIRRAFLSLVRLESAPESSKAACQVAFETASVELGRLRIDGKQIAYNPFLLYRKIQSEKDVRSYWLAKDSHLELIMDEPLEDVIEEWHKETNRNPF